MQLEPRPNPGEFYADKTGDALVRVQAYSETSEQVIYQHFKTPIDMPDAEPMPIEDFLADYRLLVPSEYIELALKTLKEAWSQSEPEVAWYNFIGSAQQMMERAAVVMEGFEQPRLFFNEKDIEGLRMMIEIVGPMRVTHEIMAGVRVSEAMNGAVALLGRLEKLAGPKDELEQAANHIHSLLRREDVSESDHQTDIKAAVEFLGTIGL